MRARRASALSVLLAAVLLGVALAARRYLAVITVRGPSMLPAFASGSRVLVRLGRSGRLRVGDVVVCAEPDQNGQWRSQDRPSVARGDLVIKRVAALPGQPVPAAALSAAGQPSVPAGRLVVLGDNPARSRDSRHWGFVPRAAVLGRIVLVLSGGADVTLDPAVHQRDRAVAAGGQRAVVRRE